MERRLKFVKGQQKLFIKNAANNIGSLKLLANMLKVPYSTFKKYAYELLLMPENIYAQIVPLSTLNISKIKFIYLPSNWGNIKAGKKGMKALERKYPDKINKWRGKGVRRFIYSNIKEIKIPKINEDMAEFFGAYLGDGTLTKYFIRISGDSRYDVPYFNYLNELVSKLFGISGKILKSKNTNTLYFNVHSKKICDFFNNQLKINYGDKIRNNTLIPPVIFEKDLLMQSCLRGLIDTDGCVSLRGQSFSISFYSKNPNLIEQVKSFSDRHKLFTYVSKNRDEIGTNSKEKIILYFRKIGSSNLRHIVRFSQNIIFKNRVYQNKVKKYYRKSLYRGIGFPFRLVGPLG